MLTGYEKFVSQSEEKRFSNSMVARVLKSFFCFLAERCGKRRFLTQADAFLHKLIDYSSWPLELFISFLSAALKDTACSFLKRRGRKFDMKSRRSDSFVTMLVPN